ncbi:MAG: IPExxxVDY family protein [Bacteroidota bacterium]
MKKKVHKLEDNYKPGSVLVGISSHENDYRLSWAINQAFGFNLSKTENVIIHDKKNGLKDTFSCFNYHDEDSLTTFNLISNRSENTYLLPDQKNIDFILKVSGDLEAVYLDSLIFKLRRIPIIITAFVLPELKIKYRNRLEF